MRPVVPVLALASTLFLPVCRAQDHPLVTSLRQAAIELVDRNRVPGLAIAVVEHGSVLHAEGFGWADLESERPMTAATPINVGSISKSVAAWGFLRFCRSRGISLDDAVPPLVRRFELRGAKSLDRSGVTVRRVLSHSAGLSTPSAPVFPATSFLPPVLRVLEGKEGGTPRVRLFRQPGVGFSYSGGGYLLLQLMLEEATGASFSGFMSREVLAPTGMASSSFRLNRAIRSAAATYYRSDGRVRALYHLPGAAGALYSTAEDMGRWLTLYAQQRSTYEALLPEAAFRELLEPQVEMFEGGIEAAGSSYALGHATWTSRDGRFYVFHGGGNPGLRAYYFVEPKTGSGLFMVANHDDGQVAFRDLIDAWARHYRVPPPPLF